jgi:uncharacterized protein (DUF1501 family)
MHIRSRREFMKSSLKSISALGVAGAMAKFGEINAFASVGSNYQALVCVFLGGGNDGHNTIIPLKTGRQDYSTYKKGREILALPENTLLPIGHGADSYGLHPSLTEIQGLYNQGSAGILANVGMLVQPLTRSAYQSNNSALIPIALFSHSDQASQWQSAMPNGLAATGWGGRITDVLQSQNSGAIFPPITMTAECGLFCTGKDTFPASVPPAGISSLDSITSAPAFATGMQQLLTFDDGLQLVHASNDIVTRGNTYAKTLTALLRDAKVSTPFPANNPLAAQLRTVARVIAVRKELGLTRQIFFCQLNGFDTHGGQLPTQKALLSQLSQAVAAFYKATQELSVERSVTTFTASEFGRSLSPSGNAGSDHAWGNHHFVVGGAVQGGKIYGEFPHLALGGEQDVSSRGLFIPTTAVAQYGATLAQWFGVGGGNLSTVFPNIKNFSSPNIGFFG